MGEYAVAVRHEPFVYNPAVRELRRLVQEGELGRIYYGDSARLNLGVFQRQANVAWDLAPHDTSGVVRSSRSSTSWPISYSWRQ